MSELPTNTLDGQVSTEPARTIIFSLRNVENHVSRACGYTFEDVIASELENAQIIGPNYKESGKLAFRANVLLSKKLGLGTALGLCGSTLEQDCELFFFSAAQPRDLVYLNTIKNWRARSRYAICWLQELWINDIQDCGKLLNILEQFDHVICPFYHTTEPLRERIDTPVTYITWGVDTKLFCPFPTPPNRAIDICGIGEVSPAMHEALVEYSDRTGKYYQYSTTYGHHAMHSHVAHRSNYASMLKRSRYFLSFIAKVVRTNQRGSQEEFGLRYLEAAAAGTIMLGNNLANPSFDKYFGWDDSVIELPFTSSGVADVIDRLESDPERVAKIRKNNVINSLRRHDHLHRWEEVLKIANMDQLPKMSVRRDQLAELARMAEAQD